MHYSSIKRIGRGMSEEVVGDKVKCVAASASQSSSTTKTTKERKRHGARNQHKIKHIVKWLLDTFSFLREANGRTIRILDVAGGKGELAARLVICCRFHVTMVDPRPANIIDCFERTVLPKLPKKWQEPYHNSPDVVCKRLRDSFQQHVLVFTEETVKESAILQEALTQCDLIVGVHADSATEAIVDAALQYKKPFVVIPCCVFPNLFRERRIWDATSGEMVSVRTYEQFCDYLAAKHARLKIEKIPFEGRNMAIWGDAKDY